MRVEMLPQMGALLEALAAHGAGVAPVSTMDSQNVRLDVAVAGEQLEADTTGMFITDLAQLTDVGVLVMLLVLVSLQHDSALDGLVAGVALVRRVQILVVGGAGQVVDRVGQDGVLFVGSLLALLAAA